MKIKICFSLLLTAFIALATSCEKNYPIGGYFVNKISEKPICGLEVGLYQGLLSADATLNDFDLLSTTITDSSGRFVFEIGENDNNQLFYLPITTTDTNSVNSKYVITFHNLDNIDWSKTKIWTLLPSTETSIVFSQSKKLDALILKYENQISYGNRVEDKVIYTLFLTSGESHSIGLYYNNGNEEEFYKNIEIYVKSSINEEDRIQWIKPNTIRFEIDNI